MEVMSSTPQNDALHAAVHGLPTQQSPVVVNTHAGRKEEQHESEPQMPYREFPNVILTLLESKYGLDERRLLNGSTTEWLHAEGNWLARHDWYNKALQEFADAVHEAGSDTNTEQFEKLWNSHMTPAICVSPDTLHLQRQPPGALVPYVRQPGLTTSTPGQKTSYDIATELTLVWSGPTLHYYNASYKKEYAPADLMVQIPKQVMEDVGTRYLYVSGSPCGYDSDGYHRCITRIYAVKAQ